MNPQTANIQTPKPSWALAIFEKVLVVAVNTHRKYAREESRKLYKELKQESQRTKRQSMNLGTVGLCARGPGLPRCKQEAELCPARS